MTNSSPTLHVAERDGVRPFLPDDAIARRLRAVETQLRGQGLSALATEIAEIAVVLESEETTT